MLHARLLCLPRHASLRLRGHFAWFLIVDALYFGILSDSKTDDVIRAHGPKCRWGRCYLLFPVADRDEPTSATARSSYGLVRNNSPWQECTVQCVLNPRRLLKVRFPR
jgi:hypothetical protein